MPSIEDYNFKISFPVHWGEMDSFGHVNNIQFLKYHESARISYFQEIGLTGKSTASVAPILANISCQFLQPIEYPDEVTVGTKTTKIGNTSFVMDYSIFTKKLGVVATGEAIIVCYNYATKQKTAIPTALKEAIQKLDGLVG